MSARIKHVETIKTTNVVCPLTAMEIRNGIKTKAVPETQAIAASFFKRLLVSVSLCYLHFRMAAYLSHAISTRWNREQNVRVSEKQAVATSSVQIC